MPARKRTDQPQQHEDPRLLVSREALAKDLAQRRVLASGLIERAKACTADTELRGVRQQYYTWDEYNEALLKKRIAGPVSEEYRGISFGGGDLTIKSVVDDIEYKDRQLLSIIERLPLWDETATTERPASLGTGSKVFIVHGHDAAAKVEVARFCRQVTGVEPVILHEQASGGKTVIEKLAYYAGEAGFAIVLLTGDDEGGKRGEQVTPRARQNVVFELGYFIGKIGRHRVAALYQQGVELPSDLSGVVWIAYDAAGTWQLPLAREMRTAGIVVDLNQAL